MIAPLLWFALLGAPPAAQQPVQLRAFDCPSLNQSDVRHALKVELHDRLIEPTAPTPRDVLTVEIGCPGGDLIVRVERSGDTPAGNRRISRSGATGRVFVLGTTSVGPIVGSLISGVGIVDAAAGVELGAARAISGGGSSLRARPSRAAAWRRRGAPR